HPPKAGVVIASLLGTTVAVCLAELYSETLGTEGRTRRRVAPEHRRAIWADAVAVAFGISFPTIFFLLAAAGAIDLDTALDLAQWVGLWLIGLDRFDATT